MEDKALWLVRMTAPLDISAVIPTELPIATSTIVDAPGVCAAQMGLPLPEHCALEQCHNKKRTMPMVPRNR